jgi:hypothetical protein
MFKRSVSVQWREQEEGNFLVYFNQNVFEVNEIVARILELCASPQSAESLTAALLEEYDVKENILRKDILFVISQLQEKDILEET